MPERNELFPALLKYWRARRGLSQLDLALAADVSARHVSFLETGRSAPSEEMVLRLGATLDVSLRDQNGMLRAAGFAPVFDEAPLDALEDPAIERAITRMMRQHEPYPMLVMDRAYDVLRMNDGAIRLVELALGRVPEPFNAMRTLFDPEGVRPIVSGWETVARDMISRVQREHLHSPQDERLARLLEDLLAAPGVPADWRTPDFARGAVAAFAFRFELAGAQLGFLSTMMQFAAPQNVALDELQIESWFPLDEATEAVLGALGA